MGRVGFFMTLFRIIYFVCFIGFLIIGVQTSDQEITKPTRRNFKSLEAIGRERHVDVDVVVVHPAGLDPNYMMSKRKVPNGPDPIHNRRAGNSGRPPGQA